jgi:hypothetical protein
MVRCRRTAASVIDPPVGAEELLEGVEASVQ